jgi:hypothetical protein
VSAKLLKSFIRFPKLVLVFVVIFSLFVPMNTVSATAAGYSLYFDGNNDYVSVAATETVLGGAGWQDTMSISVWVKPMGSAGCLRNDVAWCDSILGDRPRWWGISRGTVDGLDRIWIWNRDDSIDQVGIPYTEGEWVHIAMVHAGGMLSAYKNGQFVGSVASGTTQQPSTGAKPNLQFGSVINNSDRNWSFQGEIDEIRIYSTVLSQSDIQSALFTELSGSEPGLRAYYKMSNGSGLLLTDDSVNSFDGVLMDGGGIVAPDGAYPLWVTSNAFDKPLAGDISATTDEDVAVGITLLGQGAPGSPLTYTVADPPHGSVTGTGANRTYTPDANYSGADSFTYQAWVNGVASAPATVSVSINSLNDVPVANTQSLSLNEDTQLTGTLTATDADGDPLTYIITAQPTHGVLSGSYPSFTYTPAANYFGADSFAFKVNDTHVDSNTATINLTVNSVNDVPVADNKIINTPLNTSVAVLLTGSDVENSPLTFTVTGSPAHGSLTGTSPNLIYTPNTGYVGSDSFTYTASDSQAVSPPATVTINITSGNQPPVANDQSVTTDEDTQKAITLSASDPEAQPLTYTVLSQPTHGTLSGSAPAVTYHPNANFNGSDSFTFKASDGQIDSNIATVSITVNSLNDAPVANSFAIQTAVNTPVSISLTGSDVENAPLTFSVVTNPQHGTLSGTPPSLIYTPENGYSGVDSLTYRANDGTVNSELATVTITVSSGNLPPVANPQDITLNEDTPTPITLTGFDAEGVALSYSFLHPTSHGSLLGTAPDMTYTPHTNYYGTDYFIFRVWDGVQWSEGATVNIVVEPVNDAPRAIPQAVSTSKNVYLDIQLSGADVDGDILSFTIANGPSHGDLGAINPATNVVRYTPDSNYVGLDFFQFRASDGTLTSNISAVTINVTDEEVNVAPLANDDQYLANINTILSIPAPGVLSNDSDPNGDTITAELVSGLSGLTLNPNGSFIYTPPSGFSGDVSFTYHATDGSLQSGLATVTIHVVQVKKLFLPFIIK